MSVDFWATAAVATELRQTSLPARVQQVLQTDATSLALELYAQRTRRYLLVSADPQAPRLHLLSEGNRPRRGVDTASPFLQLLRKYVRGAGLLAVQQPAWERVLLFDVQHPEFGATMLAVELIGRWANVLLLRPVTHDGAPALRILECLHHHRAAEQTARPALPGQLYQPPPAQSALPPEALDEEQAQRLLAAADAATPLWRVLVDGLAGISPQAGREIVFRAWGETNRRAGQVESVAPLVAEVRAWVTLAHEQAWQPCLARDAAGVVTAFAPYLLTHRTDAVVEPAVSISQAIESFYGEKQATAGDAYAAARRQVQASLAAATRTLEKRRAALQREVRPAAEIEQLRASGEWILALATQIVPRQTELTLPEGVDFGPVRLDPALSAAENAAAYFKRYRKARRAGDMNAPRLAALDSELAYLEQLGADLTLAADRNEIDAVRAALAEAGYARQRRQTATVTAKVPVQGPRRFTSREGYAIWVGRNSRQNDHVTFDLAGPDDLWLHARGWPGAHVVIRSGGRAVSDATVQQAASLAAYYSKAQNEGRVDVIVAERRRVRRAPGRPHPGMVTVEGERVVRVRPASDISQPSAE